MNGKKALEWWRGLCVDECTATPENGKLGDQRYLDDLMEVFPTVVSSNNIGLNAAPWNIENYNISASGSSVLLNNDPLLLYHFQGLEIFTPRLFDIYNATFPISRDVRRYIYQPYLRALSLSFQRLSIVIPGFAKGTSDFWRSPRTVLTYLKRTVIAKSNLVRI